MSEALFAGTYQMHTAGFRVPADAVAATLPRELVLDSGKKRARVFFLFGQQAIRMTIGPLAEVYEEALFAIPGVRLRANPGAGLFNYMPKVYVSRLLPLVVNAFFGFPKHLARFHRVGEAVEIRDLLSGTLRVRLSCEDMDVAHKWDWFDDLTKDTWHLPSLNVVAGQVLEADAVIRPGELVRPSRISMQFDVPELPYLEDEVDVAPIEKKTLGGFSTTQNYRFGIAQRLPFSRLLH